MGESTFAHFDDGDHPHLADALRRMQGVWVRNQADADRDVPHLLRFPGRRFVGVFPMEGPVDLLHRTYSWPRPGVLGHDVIGVGSDMMFGTPKDRKVGPAIDLVVVGGGDAPVYPDWVRSLRDQCDLAGVAFYFLGWGEWAPELQHGTDVKDVVRAVADDRCRALFPDGKHLMDLTGRGTNGEGAVVVVRVGKKAAGRLLDGRLWNQFPAAPAPAPASVAARNLLT